MCFPPAAPRSRRQAGATSSLSIARFDQSATHAPSPDHLDRALLCWLLYGELGTLVHTGTGLAGTSWTYLEADEIAESGLGRLISHLRVIIRTWGDSRNHKAIREIEWELDRA